MIPVVKMLRRQTCLNVCQKERQFSNIMIIFNSKVLRGVCLSVSTTQVRSSRKTGYIKMSSPYLNNLIIIGCMLTYSSVIFLGLDSTLTSVEAFPYICTARAWLLMAGFSLAFGSMFSKTWRVHSIFTDVKLNKKVASMIYIHPPRPSLVRTSDQFQLPVTPDVPLVPYYSITGSLVSSESSYLEQQLHKCT
uniref:G-protein coupled receptors family 3 profile domain-containing protein n=1 Tax=Timema monikensis TaxID=170555 RepID=A0A7R9EEG4_9NEOP|nr:unnamed protein product [Timema monikensis]